MMRVGIILAIWLLGLLTAPGGGFAAPTGAPPKVALPMPHNLAATVSRAEGEAPKVALPIPHNLVATVSRAEGEAPKVALPMPHNLVATVSRATPGDENGNNSGKRKNLNESVRRSAQGRTEESFACSFDGEWESNWGKMVLHQNGSLVKGTYAHDSGKIEGRIRGKVLTGHWAEAPTYDIHSSDGGDVTFTLSDDCKSFSGRWRYGTEGDWYGTWTAKKWQSRAGR